MCESTTTTIKNDLINYQVVRKEYCFSHLTIFFQDLGRGFFIYRKIKKNT